MHLFTIDKSFQQWKTSSYTMNKAFRADEHEESCSVDEDASR